MYTKLCDKLHTQHVSNNHIDVQVYFYWCLPSQYLQSLQNHEWTKNVVTLDIVCLIHLLIYRECPCPWNFTGYYIDVLFSGHISIICSLLICIFSIRRLGKNCESNLLFDRGWNNNHLVLSTFRENLFDLNHVETLANSTSYY